MQIFNFNCPRNRLDTQGQCFPGHSLTVMVKGTFRLQPNGVAIQVDEGDVLLIDGDRHIGCDTEKSLEYATDFAI
jgi:hypothetical protein